MCNLVSRVRSFPSQQKLYTPGQSGTMIPFFSGLDNTNLSPKYIYAGTIFPETIKGPYQHTVRSGILTLVSGNILVVHKAISATHFCEDYLEPLDRITLWSNEQYCLIGLGKETSTFINVCDYEWQPGDKETIVPDFSGYDFKQWRIK